MKYCLVPLGCQMNLSDAERIHTVLRQMGMVETDQEDDADLLGVVACSVRQRAIDKVYTRIHLWNQWKQRRSLLTFVTGCVLAEDERKFLKLFDLVFRISDVADLPDLIHQYGVTTPARQLDLAADSPFWHVPPAYSSSFSAYVPIQNGCDKFCTFCAVPYTRGREVSRPSADVLAEVERLAASGYRSITLLGQNVNSYGLDTPESELSFAELLDAIGRIGDRHDNRFWLYFTSPHPADMNDEVLRAMARYPSLAKQVHLPLQSGDDKVLIRMNRNYRLDHYRRIVDRVRAILPGATLSTDAIVGFSGESELQFQATADAFREFAYNMAYVAMYSPRPGAASSRWPDDVPHDEKKRRLHVLQNELHASSMRANKAMIGHEFPVLVEARARKDGFLLGRTEGRTLVQFPWPDSDRVGDIVPVRITSAAPMAVAGESVSPPVAVLAS